MGLHKFFAATFLLAVFFISGFANAALVRGTMSGFIAEYAETNGEGVNVFSLDGANLLGQSFVVDFYYRTDIAPVTYNGVSSFSARTFYESSDAGLDWLGLAITVNNITYDVVGNNRYADVLDIYTDPNLGNNDWLQLSIESNSGPDDGISFRRQFLVAGVSFRNHILDGAVLPTTLSSTEIERVFNSAHFRINEFDYDPITGNLLYERYVGFALDIQSIEAAVVPVPGAIWLFGSGLIGLISLYSRKKA